jgi:hypothetical protein
VGPVFHPRLPRKFSVPCVRLRVAFQSCRGSIPSARQADLYADERSLLPHQVGERRNCLQARRRLMRFPAVPPKKLPAMDTRARARSPSLFTYTHIRVAAPLPHNIRHLPHAQGRLRESVPRRRASSWRRKRVLGFSRQKPGAVGHDDVREVQAGMDAVSWAVARTTLIENG